MITNKCKIITKALIEDDQILVLGGLFSDEETEIREKAPYLGNLPLIGKLFSSLQIRSRLLVVMGYLLQKSPSRSILQI